MRSSPSGQNLGPCRRQATLADCRVQGFLDSSHSESRSKACSCGTGPGGRCARGGQALAEPPDQTRSLVVCGAGAHPVARMLAPCSSRPSLCSWHPRPSGASGSAGRFSCSHCAVPPGAFGRVSRACVHVCVTKEGPRGRDAPGRQVTSALILAGGDLKVKQVSRCRAHHSWLATRIWWHRRTLREGRPDSQINTPSIAGVEPGVSACGRGGLAVVHYRPGYWGRKVPPGCIAGRVWKGTRPWEDPAGPVRQGVGPPGKEPWSGGR